MVPEERLMLGNVTRITPTAKQELWSKSGYDLYSFSHVVRDVASVTCLLISAPRPKTQLETIIDELDRLRSRTNSRPGYVFKPSKHAIRSAKFYIYETYAKMMDTFPRPSFVLDGQEGIIIKWSNNGYTVRLNCMAGLGDPDYIYFENGDYDVEDNVTPDTLKDRLNWLIQHEREPAR